jgi:hypothetical protein
MSSSEAALEAIRARRETRDRLMLQHSLPLLEQLKNMVQEWIDGEFTDLEDLISQVDCFAARDSASERINRYRIELAQIRNEQLPKALRELNELIDYIKAQSFSSAEEATRTLQSKINPILSVVFALSRSRDRLDGMADMIQTPRPLADE